MTEKGKIALGLVVWVGAVSVLHGALNVEWSALMNDRLPEAERKLNVAYIPVT